MHLRPLCGVLGLVVCALTARVHADPPAPEQARGLAAQQAGDRLRAAGDNLRAVEYYRAAYAILHEPQSGLALASTQSDLGQLVEARQTAADVAALPAAPDEAPDSAKARAAAAKLAADIEARLPVFGVVVSPEATYTLRIDGVPVPESAQNMRFRTNPGPHTIEVVAAGYEPLKQQFALGEGVHQLFQIALIPEGGQPAVAAAPKAEVAAPAAATQPEPPEDPAVEAKRVRGYIALAIGGTAFTAGAITGVLSFTETSNAKRNCPDNVCPERLRSDLETADTMANIANVALPIGLLGIAYGLYELLTIPERQPSASSRLQLQVDGRGAYASWRGQL